MVERYKATNTLLPWTIIISMVTALSEASYGDRSYIFQRCKHNCLAVNCTESTLPTFRDNQPWYEERLYWSCEDECKYNCMWRTVDAFNKDGMKVPQFYGKWPFTRFYGIQEPASMLFSILNGLCHLRILEYRKVVPPSTPMYRVWTFLAVNGLHTWIWSTIFHTRDTNFTEMMDYFCAFSLVLCNIFGLFCRVCRVSDQRKVVVMAVSLVMFYLQHVFYLAFVKFDYGYNMKVNVACGFVNMVGWLYWCHTNRAAQPYVWKCATVMIGLNVLLSLELGDFPPILWILDAHSLWHAGTIFLGYLWYSFIIDDGRYLSQDVHTFKKD